MKVPAIKSCDEWEALASVQQDALIAASYEDRCVPQEKHVVIGKDPADVSHRYR